MRGLQSPLFLKKGRDEFYRNRKSREETEEGGRFYPTP